MECLSPQFVAAMHALLASAARAIATIALRSDGFIAEVTPRPEVESWVVDAGIAMRCPRAVAWLREPGPAARQ